MHLLCSSRYPWHLIVHRCMIPSHVPLQRLEVQFFFFLHKWLNCVMIILFHIYWLYYTLFPVCLANHCVNSVWFSRQQPMDCALESSPDSCSFTWLKTFNLTRQAYAWLLCFWCCSWFGVEGSRIFHLNILIFVASYCFRKVMAYIIEGL